MSIENMLCFVRCDICQGYRAAPGSKAPGDPALARALGTKG